MTSGLIALLEHGIPYLLHLFHFYRLLALITHSPLTAVAVTAVALGGIGLGLAVYHRVRS